MSFIIKFQYNSKDLFILSFNSTIARLKVANELKMINELLEKYVEYKIDMNNIMEISAQILNEMEPWYKFGAPYRDGFKLWFEYTAHQRMESLLPFMENIEVTNSQVTANAFLADAQTVDINSTKSENPFVHGLLDRHCYVIKLDDKTISMINVMQMQDNMFAEAKHELNMTAKISDDKTTLRFVVLPFTELQDLIECVMQEGYIKIKTTKGKSLLCRAANAT